MCELRYKLNDYIWRNSVKYRNNITGMLYISYQGHMFFKRPPSEYSSITRFAKSGCLNKSSFSPLIQV